MAFLLVRHKVKDYDKWEDGFDLDEPNRWASGSKGGLILRNVDDPSEVVVVLEWDSAKALREFTASKALKNGMKRSGVIDEPDMYVVDVEERPRA
jgi:heme-degrading monooxygenase HmoA